MRLFLSKGFPEVGLDTVDYWRCEDCGFVISKTHVEMTREAWENLNYKMHAGYQATRTTAEDDPLLVGRLQKQAEMLCDVQELGILKRGDRWLDYACGDGRLSDILLQVYSLQMLKYERYMPKREGYLDGGALVPGGFDFVITTSVFEHLARREQFDAIENLLGKQGVLGIHTLVCEEVPADPAWFYMNPVHCAFHTNKSMEILFRQWGYKCSIYNVEAKLWLWFKSEPKEIEAIIQGANVRSRRPHYIFKAGFVDYWKASPIRRSFTDTQNPLTR
jgi:hypothetical protein